MLVEIQKEELLKLIETILECPIQIPAGDYNREFWCEYCNAKLDEMQDPKDFVHEESCIVILANRLKKRYENT
jgi:hypothetical protein